MSGTNQAVKPQKMAGDFEISDLENRDIIGSLMRLLQPKPRYGPSSTFLMNIFFAL